MPIISGSTSSAGTLKSAGVNRDNSGNKTTTSGSLVDLGVTATVTAVVGDILMVVFSGAWSMSTNAGAGCTWAAVTTTGGNVVFATIYNPPDTINKKLPVAYTALYTVVSGDLSGNNCAVKMQWNSDGVNTLTLFNSGGNDFALAVVNLGH